MYIHICVCVYVYIYINPAGSALFIAPHQSSFPPLFLAEAVPARGLSVVDGYPAKPPAVVVFGLGGF